MTAKWMHGRIADPIASKVPHFQRRPNPLVR